MKLDLASHSGTVIATALRGPDIFGEDKSHRGLLKDIFTARLRYMAGIDDENGFIDVRTQCCLACDAQRVADALIYLDEIDSDGLAHFLDHTQYAYDMIRVYGYYSREARLLAFLCGACASFLSAHKYSPMLVETRLDYIQELLDGINLCSGDGDAI